MRTLGPSSTNTEILALRAGAESYSQAFLDQLSTGIRTSAGLFPQTSHEMLGLQRALNPRAPNDLIAGIAGGVQFPSNSVGGSGANLSGSIAALLASGFAPAGQHPNMMNAGASSSAVTRHYLQLLQDRQDAANLAQLTSGTMPKGNVASQYLSGTARRGYNQDPRKL
jgi:hypothetical protein